MADANLRVRLDGRPWMVTKKVIIRFIVVLDLITDLIIHCVTMLEPVSWKVWQREGPILANL